MVLLLASPVLVLASSRYLSLVKEVFPDVYTPLGFCHAINVGALTSHRYL